MGKIDQAIALLKDTMVPPALPSTASTTAAAASAASAVAGVTNGSGSDKKGDDDGDKMVIDVDEDEDDDDDGDSDEEEEEDEDDEEEKSDSDSDDDRYSKIKHKQTLINKLSQMRKMQAKQKKTALAPPPVQVISERLKPFQVQIDALNSVKTTIGLAAESLKKKEFR
jgi:TATA-binding protein-associated factor Taf7